jgi:hypothetical protein
MATGAFAEPEAFETEDAASAAAVEVSHSRRFIGFYILADGLSAPRPFL